MTDMIGTMVYKDKPLGLRFVRVRLPKARYIHVYSTTRFLMKVEIDPVLVGTYYEKFAKLCKQLIVDGTVKPPAPSGWDKVDTRVLAPAPALLTERKWRIVGIDGRHTPDPDYWFARWDIIESVSDSDAIGQWYRLHEGWAREDECHAVKVQATLNEYTNVHLWIRDNMAVKA